MSKILLVATVIATCASTSIAQDALDMDLQLPADVAERVAELRAYGDRFAEAIRLIEAEANKPDWGWASCGHDHTVVSLALPES